MNVPITHVLPLAQIRRARMLPTRGNVLARVGQKVNATDIVAESENPGAHILVDVRRALNLRRIDETHKLIDYKVGEKIEKGDIIAQTTGLISRVVRSPVDGRVVAIQRGQVLLERTGSHLELKAGISGTVTEILPDRGVVIETSGVLVQGVWGNGQVNLGMLQLLAAQPDAELTRSNLDVSWRGTVILAGNIQSLDALTAAEELNIRGLILGSISSELIPAVKKISFPVILTEGFGQIPVNTQIFNLLKTNEKRDVSLNAAWDIHHGEKPEIVIPLPATGQKPVDQMDLAPGKLVRILTAPYAGKTGNVVQIRPGQSLLPNGIRAQAAEIRLENSEVILVPLANLDMLE